MESALKNRLNVSVKCLKDSVNGGCINKGSVYQTSDNRLLFVKRNSKFGVISVLHNIYLLV